MRTDSGTKEDDIYVNTLQIWLIMATNPEVAQYAIWTGNHLQQRHLDLLMITTQSNGQSISMLNKSFIENPSTQKCSSPHFLTVGYF